MKTFLVYSAPSQTPKQDPARLKHTLPFFILKSCYDLLRHSFQVTVALKMLDVLVVNWNGIGSAASAPQLS